jgi:hypothetical protein
MGISGLIHVPWLYHEDITLGDQCVGGWGGRGPRAVLDAAGKRKTLWSCWESNPESPIVQPVASPLFWLDYLALCELCVVSEYIHIH